MANGIFFDGRSAKPINVKVNCTDDTIELKFEAQGQDLFLLPYGSISQIQEYSGRTIIKFSTENIPMTLEVMGTSFIKELKEKNSTNPYFADPHRVIFNMGKKGLLVSIFIILAGLTFLYYIGIPTMITLAVNIFPKKYEIELGQKLKEEYLKQSDIDSAKTVYINDFYNSLKKQPEYPIHITVVNSGVMNAFALPGGELVIYTGILDSMKTYSELIGLLGHETGHVEHRHSLKAIFKNLFNYLAISILFQDYSGMMAIMIENASMLDNLAYSRSNETESDEYGYAMVVLNKGNPEEMARLFQSMLDESEGIVGGIPDFIMTHPKLEERIKSIQERFKKAPTLVEQNELLRVKFQQARDGISYE